MKNLGCPFKRFYTGPVLIDSFLIYLSLFDIKLQFCYNCDHKNPKKARSQLVQSNTTITYPLHLYPLRS